ncbi:hypothetical protein D7Y44_01635 [Stenotrophomonas maltophilia]|nr:hypothetical protein [Stenotrophomonas maltophilia]MBA0344953.1 hypothetical protein [Stenotrophomonas maltophilia]MBA0356149.1 hypothetical protein [Stenotrophomonas maltophilia]MBA0518444.1 hypothetical protein [Stenotrophomonas maltophilia]
MLFEFNSKYSICLENHPRMAWIYQTWGICQRWGGVGVRGVSRMDAAAKPYLIGIWQRRCREPAWAAV